jgi:hypothetical protein
MCHRGQPRLGFRRVAALACALAYLISGTETFPELLALGAWIEGAHTVHVGRSQGHLTTVLSHERGAASRPGCGPRSKSETRLHQHGPGARIFCLFTDPTAPTADHVASFPAALECEHPAGTGELKLPAGLAKTPAAPVTLAFIPAAPEASSLAEIAQAPPRPPDSLRCLRSTVLVI